MQEIKVHLVTFKGRDVFYMRYVDPVTGKQVTRSTRKVKRKDAQKAAGAWESELRDGRYQSPSRVKWATFRRRYEDEVLLGKSDGTAKKVATIFGSVEKHINPKLLAALNPERLSMLQAKLRESGLSETSIKSNLAHLRAALGWAKRQRLVVEVPIIDMPTRTNTARHRALTLEEFERMLSDTPKVVGTRRAASWERLLTGLWWSGLRIGEAARLTWDTDNMITVDTTGSRVMLHIPAAMQKNHKTETVPVAPEFEAFLLATPEADRTGFVFNPLPRFLDEKHSGRRLSEQQMAKVVAAIGERAGVKVGTTDAGDPEFATAHDFRRAFGTRWATRVMPIALKQVMRHKSVATTLAYYVTEDAEKTADAMHDAIGNTPGNSGFTATAGGENEKTEVVRVQQLP